MPTTINGTTGVNLITDGSIVTADFASGAINGTVLPTGSVLQVVNGTYSTQVSNSTSTYADTGLTASITPSSASNKILVLVNQASIGKDTGNISSGCIVKLLRNSTDICVFAGPAGYTQTNIYNLGWNASASYLDNPSTTSSVTYKTQFANGVNAASVRVQTDNNTSTIVLMEIKG